METQTTLQSSKCPRKSKVCGQDCVLISSRPDFRMCSHLNPVVVLTDIGKTLKTRSQQSKSIRETNTPEPKAQNNPSAKSQLSQTEFEDESAEAKEEAVGDAKKSNSEKISESARGSMSEKFATTKSTRKRKLSWDPNIEYEVERIVGYSRYKKYKMLYLVQWKNYENCTTLEPFENLTGCLYELMKCLERNRKPSEAEISKKDRELMQVLHNRVWFKQLKSNGWKLSDLKLFKALDVMEILNTKDLDELEKRIRRQYRYILRCLIAMADYPDSKLVQSGLDYQLYLTLIKRRKLQLLQLHEAKKAINSLENVPIELENSVDFDLFPDIKYVTDMVLGKDVVLPGPVLGCECKKGCSIKSHCCGVLAGSKFAYDNLGKLRFDVKIPIYECNSKCMCDSSCTNRVVQKGRQFMLGIFKTTSCGWGVKALEDIPKGSFVCEYFGELIRESEANARDNDYFQNGTSYLFDLDFDEGNNEMFCIDATLCGNLSRFINHSCEPNLMVLPVWIDCLEANLHRLAFFAVKDIKKDEEVTFDYESADSGDERRDEEEKENKRPRMMAGLKCLCGKEKCREWLFGC